MSDWAEEKARELIVCGCSGGNESEINCHSAYCPRGWVKVDAIAAALREAEARGRKEDEANEDKIKRLERDNQSLD